VSGPYLTNTDGVLRDPLWVRLLEQLVRAVTWVLWKLAGLFGAVGWFIEQIGWKISNGGHAVSDRFCNLAEAAAQRREKRKA
jgi:hypothetical protein